MYRSLMYDSNRLSLRFPEGVQEFARTAVEHQSQNEANLILCPCRDCNNARGYREVDEITDHVIHRGFKSNYTTWSWHGESLDVGEITSKEKDDVEDVFEVDRMEEMMANVVDDLDEQHSAFDYLSSASETPLYDGCETFTKLSGVLGFFNL
ncbi:hypothetical protein RDABS01_021587 [Bienertia sinuspersici]